MRSNNIILLEGPPNEVKQKKLDKVNYAKSLFMIQEHFERNQFISCCIKICNLQITHPRVRLFRFSQRLFLKLDNTFNLEGERNMTKVAETLTERLAQFDLKGLHEQSLLKT